MTEGIKVSLWGKFDEIFPTVTFKIPPKGKEIPVQAISILEALLWGEGVTCWVGVPGVPAPGRWSGPSLLRGAWGVQASRC